MDASTFNALLLAMVGFFFVAFYKKVDEIHKDTIAIREKQAGLTEKINIIEREVEAMKSIIYKHESTM